MKRWKCERTSCMNRWQFALRNGTGTGKPLSHKLAGAVESHLRH